MLTLHRLLVPDDRSPCTARAHAHALPLAQRIGAEVHLVHAVVPVDTPTDIPAELSETPEGLSLVEVLAHGDSVAEALVGYAEIRDIDLIVMGTHGRRGLAHLTVGSVAERVVRLAPCPVLTIHADEGPPAPGAFGHLLVPFDFSGHAEVALRHAAALAEAFGARLDLLHAVEPSALPEAYDFGLLWGHNVPDLLAHSRVALHRIAEAHLDPEHRGDVLVETNTPAAAILDAAEERRPDLIIMTTHGRTGLKRFALGSVAEKVVQYATCPVLTVKSFGKSLVPEAPPASTASDLGPADVGVPLTPQS